MGKRVAIACQGGGSQCAFSAGVLKALFASGIHRRVRIVGLSGTSGGAINACLAWYGLLRQASGDPSPIEDRIIACWKELSAQTWREAFFDQAVVQTVRLADRGVLPTFASSPSSIPSRALQQLASMWLGRTEFTDLRALLLKHIQFPELERLVTPESPVLLIGAADVLTGNARVFSSANHGQIPVEALLASAAVPSLFPAVKVDGHYFWDGIFSSNPPVTAFIRRPLMGSEAIPEEIWIIQVNPFECDAVPEMPNEILDRRNHMAGNLSLLHELELVEMVNLLIEQQALTQEFRERFQVSITEPIKVRTIGMSEQLRRSLDYPTKLSRQPSLLGRLIADGEERGWAFLQELAAEGVAGVAEGPGPAHTN